MNHYMACNALDYLVAVAGGVPVEAREDGVYLLNGTRWQPSVNWDQIGLFISKLKITFTEICSRYQPILASISKIEGGRCGETHQVAACNLVIFISKHVSWDTETPYEAVTADALYLRDSEFVKKYPKLSIDDIEKVARINEIGVAAFLKESAELHAVMLPLLPKMIADFSEDSGKVLVNKIVQYYPELISVEAHAKGITQ